MKNFLASYALARLIERNFRRYQNSRGLGVPKTFLSILRDPGWFWDGCKDWREYADTREEREAWETVCRLFSELFGHMEENKSSLSAVDAENIALLLEEEYQRKADEFRKISRDIEKYKRIRDYRGLDSAEEYELSCLFERHQTARALREDAAELLGKFCASFPA